MTEKVKGVLEEFAAAHKIYSEAHKKIYEAYSQPLSNIRKRIIAALEYEEKYRTELSKKKELFDYSSYPFSNLPTSISNLRWNLKDIYISSEGDYVRGSCLDWNNNERDITFRTKYLGEDYEEQIRLFYEEGRQKCLARIEKSRIKEKKKAEEKERAEYERLKAKFGE